MDASQSPSNTRHLKMPELQAAAAQKVTGPLDRSVPWVIEFRVVGTAQTTQFQVRDLMLLGRGDSERETYPEIDLSPYNAHANGVSRKHAMILVKNDKLHIKDLNSTNGTRLNGVLCEPGKEYRLRHGDDLMLGRLRMQVLFAVIPVQDGLRQTGEHAVVVAAAEPALTVPEIPEIGAGQHILVLEDDQDVGVVFRFALERAGFSVSLVNNVSSAFTLIGQRMPDVIILDLMLPDMSSLDLVRYMRKHYPEHHIPILVVSGATGGFQMSQAMAAGADLFLGKPVGVDELIRAVGTAVGR